MASMFDDIYGENEIPNGFVDENGLVHNLQYMENGDTFDTVKQSDGSYLTKIYGPDNILKGKMLTDKHNNQKKIVYQKNGIEETMKNSDGSYVLRNYDSRKTLVYELSRNKDKRFHMRLIDNGKLVNAQPKHLFKLETQAQECLRNHQPLPMDKAIILNLVNTQLAEYSKDLKVTEKLDQQNVMALTLLTDVRYRSREGKINQPVLDILNKTLLLINDETKAELLKRGNLSEGLTEALENGWSFIPIAGTSKRPKQKGSAHPFHSDRTTKEDEDLLSRCYQFCGAANFKELDRALEILQILKEDGVDTAEVDILDAILQKQKNH